MNSSSSIDLKPAFPDRRDRKRVRDHAPRADGFRIELRDGFDFARAEYADLFSASDATAFQHPIWLQHFYERLIPSRGGRMAVVTIRDDAERLLGVLPLLSRRKSGVRLLEAADLGVSDYACPVLHPELLERLSGMPRLRERIAAVLPAHDVMRIRPIRREHLDSWLALLGGRAEPLGFSAHAAELGGDHRLWRAERASRSLRGRLSRAEKQIVKQGGGTLHRLEGEDDIRQGVAALQALRAGRFEGDPIQDDAVLRFYTDVAVAGAGDGTCEIYRLDIGGEPAGYVYGLCRRGTYHYLLVGCDYQAFSRCSPGLVLYDGIIADWIGRGGTVFDFTIGDEPFKSDFGTEPTPMFGVFRTPTWRGRVALAALQARTKRRTERQQAGMPARQ